MRVLFVNHTSNVSGAEVAMIRLLRALPAAVESAVACPPDGRLAEELRDEGVEVLPIDPTEISFRLQPRTTTLGLAQTARSMWQVRGAARRWGADVIHANGSRGGLVSLLARGRDRPRLIVQIHDILPPGRAADAVRTVCRRADVITTVSEAASRAFDQGAADGPAVTTYIFIAGSIAFSGAQVRYAGHRSDVAPVMATPDLMLLPSWNEPFGTAIVEAMATGAAAELLDDPVRRAAMAERAVDTAQRFTHERYASDCLRLYEEVLQ